MVPLPPLIQPLTKDRASKKDLSEPQRADPILAWLRRCAGGKKYDLLFT